MNPIPAQFDLLHFWTQGDLLIRSTAVVLLLMSVASWVVILFKATALAGLLRGARRVRAPGREAPSSNGQNDPFLRLAIEGQEAASQHRTLCAAQQLNPNELCDWVTRQLRHRITVVAGNLQSGLAILASIGATAPFIGLFGTVWGIYHALANIGSSGQVGIEQVAGPVGETLIMTALGLAVAIPAVLGYNAISRGNRRVVAHLNGFAHELATRVLVEAPSDLTRKGV